MYERDGVQLIDLDAKQYLFQEAYNVSEQVKTSDDPGTVEYRLLHYT